MSKPDVACEDLIIKVRVPKDYPLCARLEAVRTRDRAGQLLMYAIVGLTHSESGNTAASRSATASVQAGTDSEADCLGMDFINGFLDPSRLGVVVIS